MKSLLIDTSTNTNFLALSDEGEIVSFKILEGQKNLSERIFIELGALLKEGGISLQDLAYIAAGIGPGSYMGMRTAATIAQTFSFASNIPLIEFYSPLAYLPDQDGTFAFIGDGKMGQLFVFKGEKKGLVLENIKPPFLTTPDALGPHIEKKDFVLGEQYSAPVLNMRWLARHLHYKGGALRTPLNLAYLR